MLEIPKRFLQRSLESKSLEIKKPYMKKLLVLSTITPFALICAQKTATVKGKIINKFTILLSNGVAISYIRIKEPQQMLMDITEFKIPIKKTVSVTFYTCFLFNKY